MTEDEKASIDAMSYEGLLHRLRYAPAGDPLFQGDTGTYTMNRIKELRDADPSGAVEASKRIGWETP